MEEEIEAIQLDMDEKVQIVESQIEEILETIRNIPHYVILIEKIFFKFDSKFEERKSFS